MNRRLFTALILTIATSSLACGTRVERSATVSAQRGADGAVAPTDAAPAAESGAPVEDSAATANGQAAAVSGSSTVNTAVGAKGATTAAPSAATGARSATATGGASAPRATAGGAAKRAGKTPAGATPGAPRPGGSAPAAPAGAAAAKAEIKIGEVGVFSGPIGTNMKPISDSVRIWVRWINDRGGINGHPVVLLTGDSGADPARHRALVQQLVEKGVIAFVGQPGDVFSGGGSVQYLTEQRVPVIGSEGAAHWFYESPMYFPQIQHSRALVQALAVGAAKQGVARGLSKLAIWTCVEAQTCKEVDEVVPKMAPRHGVKVVNSSKVSIGQPDFTAECLNSRNAGAEMIFMAADGSTITRGAASCARQGYRPTWVLVGATILAKQHSEDPNLSGGIGIDTQAPWFLDNTPARKEWREAQARYAPGLATTSSNMIGWVAAKLFELGLRKVPGPFTREGLLASLWSIKGDPLPELTVPYIFNPEKPATPTACYWNATPKDGKWVSADGGARHCFDYDPSI